MGRLEELETWTNERLAVLGHDPVPLPPRPRRAVVGLDGHPSAEDAVEWAQGIAREVHLVTVLPRASAYRTKPQTTREIDDRVQHRKRQVSQSKERLQAQLPKARLKHHTVRGSPIQELSGAADDLEADLIAAGARNSEKGTGAVFGSVGENLLHHAPVSTLLSQNPPGPGPIVAGVAEDEASRLAAMWAAAIAAWLDRPLVLAHAGLEPATEAFESDGPQAQARRVDWPPRHGLSRLLEGSPGGLTVLGHEGHGAWMGSTAVQLARTTPTSMLVARPWRGL